MYRVMIVEDEELLRKGLIFTFDWASLNCLIVGEARNGSEGLEMIRSLNPDLVITDIKMPVMDGLTMLSQFKQASSGYLRNQQEKQTRAEKPDQRRSPGLGRKSVA